MRVRTLVLDSFHVGKVDPKTGFPLKRVEGRVDARRICTGVGFYFSSMVLDVLRLGKGFSDLFSRITAVYLDVEVKIIRVYTAGSVVLTRDVFHSVLENC